MKILAVDIGGSYIKYAVSDEQAVLTDAGKVPTPKEGRRELIEAIGGIYDRFDGIEGIGISMPGIIDTDKGICLMGGALPYNKDFALRDAVAERCGCPVYVENDAKCATMAEASVGSLKDVSDGLVLVFGTMIGGGIVRGHNLVKGRHFAVGEVSYIIPHTDAPMTKDNVWGNLCGVPRLCRMYAEAAGLEASAVEGVQVFDAVEQGDETAKACLTKFCHDIAVRVFSLQTVLDPERVAIGGGVSVRPVFIDTIRAELEQLYEDCPFKIPHAEIVPCQYLSDANLIGAAQCMVRELKK